MAVRQSYSQQVFPNTFEFTARLGELADSGVMRMLAIVWQGFNNFKEEVLDHNFPPTRVNFDLERDLTELLYPYILKALPPSMPYYLQHEKKERHRARPGGQPPEPDLAFVMFENINVTFPMDAKVLENDDASSVTDYCDTIKNRFLTCVYGPFSDEGAMLGYLLAGSVQTAFESVAVGVPCALSVPPFFTERNHRISEHARTVPPCKYHQFRCHHLIFVMDSR
jgi:hypothetical protein